MGLSTFGGGQYPLKCRQIHVTHPSCQPQHLLGTWCLLAHAHTEPLVVASTGHMHLTKRTDEEDRRCNLPTLAVGEDGLGGNATLSSPSVLRAEHHEGAPSVIRKTDPGTHTSNTPLTPAQTTVTCLSLLATVHSELVCVVQKGLSPSPQKLF